MIRRRFPGADVREVHGKAGSRRLRNLAKSANLFIMNTWDASHAATDAICDSRGDDIILRPDGKNPPAILRCLTQHLSGVAV